MAQQLDPEQEQQPPRVSVVVVSHNRAALLRRCLEALEKSDARQTLQIVVVDNGSGDGAARLGDEFPGAQFVRLPKNFGLTKAMNIGWRAADAAYVLFLHDDAAVEPSAISRLADILDANPDAAAACPLLVDGEGRPAPQLGDLPPTGEFRPAAASGDEPAAVEYARGAALMVRVFVIKAIRQIDEHYGQFGSDADLAEQIRRASKRVLLAPAARAVHQGARARTAAQTADLLLARAVFVGKYHGFAAGLRARAAAILRPLLSFQFEVFTNTLAGRKIDGAQ